MSVNATHLMYAFNVQRTTDKTSEKISATTTTTSNNVQVVPASLATVSLMSTLLLLYYMKGDQKTNKMSKKYYSNSHGDQRSTPLPGFGIFGDRVNEFVSIFLDALAIYVHNDSKWDCQRRLLCEANQRAVDYGIVHGIIMYLTSLSVSFWLRDQKVSQSIEAMRKGRSGQDCTSSYPKCPFSL